MRTQLKQRNGDRFCVTATVKRYGGKLTSIPKMNVYSWQETILLVDVIDSETGQELTDHVWLKVGKRIEDLNAKTGDRISFCARVDSYSKRGGEDFHFEYPSKLKIIEANPVLFPEEVARSVGTGIEYAKQLREQYIHQRMDEARSSFDRSDDDDLDWTPHRQKALRSNVFDRSWICQELRKLHALGAIQLPEQCLIKGGFKEFANAELTDFLNQAKQQSEAA